MRYGFNAQNSSEPQTPTSPSKDMNYMSQGDSQEIPTNTGDPPSYSKSAIYSQHPNQPPDFNKNDQRNDEYGKNISHKRQTSSLHGHFNHLKGLPSNEQSSSREGLYGTAPDLPPRVDRAVKPLGLLTTPTKSNG